MPPPSIERSQQDIPYQHTRPQQQVSNVTRAPPPVTGIKKAPPTLLSHPNHYVSHRKFVMQKISKILSNFNHLANERPQQPRPQQPRQPIAPQPFPKSTNNIELKQFPPKPQRNDRNNSSDAPKNQGRYSGRCSCERAWLLATIILAVICLGLLAGLIYVIITNNEVCSFGQLGRPHTSTLEKYIAKNIFLPTSQVRE